jgi:acyl-CoA reductase-like NAD-dependent aldehyde dehydrogenase
MSVEIITTISPTTNKPVVTRNGISASDLDLLPTVATDSFLSFKKTSLADRQTIVKKALKLLNDKQDVLAKELTEQMGRPIAYSAKEVTTAVKRGEYLLKISEDALKDTDGEAEKGFKRFIQKVPVGPVLILFAWNVSLYARGSHSCTWVYPRQLQTAIFGESKRSMIVADFYSTHI